MKILTRFSMHSSVSNLKIASFTWLFFTIGVAYPNTSFASAGWFPTFPGDTIKVSFCLPSSSKSIAYLQITDPTVGLKKNVAKIDYRNLKKSPRCLRMMKDSPNLESGPFALEYEWRVNVKGDFALQLYIPSQKRTLFGWPDGIEMKKPKV